MTTAKVLKKFATLGLTLAMILSITACGKNQTSSDTEEKGKTEETTKETTKETTEEKTEDQKQSDKEETAKITVAVFDRGKTTDDYGTVTDNKWTKMVKEKALQDLNIELEYVAIPRSENETKIQMLMAAGNEPDIFYTYDTTKFIEWSMDGALADLLPYMDSEAGKSLIDRFGQDAIDYGMVEGELYAISGRRDAVGMLSSLVRKDMVEAVGEELDFNGDHYVITPTKLISVLSKIKEAGLCDYPYFLMNSWTNTQPIEGAFVDSEDMNNEETKLRMPENYLFGAKGDKEAWKFLNECYNAGLISPDFSLYKSDNMKEQVAAGKVAFWSGAYWDGNNEMNECSKVDTQAEAVGIELVHEDGTPANFFTYGLNGAYTMVSSECENIEAAVRLMNWMSTDEELRVWLCHGIEGEHYKIENGKYVPIDIEYNGKDRIAVSDLGLLATDPATPTTRDAQADAMPDAVPSYGEMAKKMRETAFRVSTSEGKLIPPIVNVTLDSLNTYAAELVENRDNLIINSITAEKGKFDEVYDHYYQIYLDEGLQQLGDEKVAKILGK